MTKKELKIRQHLKDDFQHYAKKCLKIRAKKAIKIKNRLQKIIPFELNRSQKYIHKKLEEQKKKSGYVRALLLKGRQQGCSSYVGGRYYHKTTFKKGVKTFILAHMEDATNNLFKMVQRFHERLPDVVKPSTSFSNRKELVFDKIDSAYGLGTAGSGDVGRSDTIDYLHGCVAYDSCVVLANRATKEIQDIKIGDMVITDSGATAPVSALFNTGKKQVYKISNWLTNESIELSADHKVLTDTGWLPVSKLTKKHYIQMPDMKTNEKNTKRFFTLKNKHRKQGGIGYAFLHGTDKGKNRADRFKNVDGKRFVKVREITKTIVKQTFDIEIDHPDHSFETPIGIISNSEVAFWNNTDSIRTGVLQAAEQAEEIILESTANGMGNMFHQMWQDARAGHGKYIAIFVPWFWQDEYREKVAIDFRLDAEEQAYYDAYKTNGLTDIEQMAWRRNKIIELKDPLLFKQEYPATAADAFQVTGHHSLINPESVIQSRKVANVQRYGAYIIGCDPAREGDDQTAFVRRQGRKAWGLEMFEKLDDMEKAGRARLILDSEPVDRMFIDRGGGSGMYDRLREMGYSERVSLVNFGGRALDSGRYKNRRAEMWGEMKVWLESEEKTQVPDDDYLQADLVAPGYTYTSTTQLLLEKKTEIKKRIGKSPDAGDALALTFAEPVEVYQYQYREQWQGKTQYETADSVTGY